MSLIDDIERLGHAAEHGTSRDDAITELRGLFEQHPAGGDIDHWSGGDLIDDWRNVRRRYEAIRDITARELRQLAAIVRIEAAATTAKETT